MEFKMAAAPLLLLLLPELPNSPHHAHKKWRRLGYCWPGYHGLLAATVTIYTLDLDTHSSQKMVTVFSNNHQDQSQEEY